MTIPPHSNRTRRYGKCVDKKSTNEDCIDIQPVHRRIFLVDCSTLICKEMGRIHIPIYNGKTNIGSPRLYNVLIVSNLGRRLFLVNSFLLSGNERVHFENNHIHLGIKDGPRIKIPISSLQSNVLIVSNKNMRTDKKTTNPNKKMKLSTNVLHDRFLRSDGALATIKPMIYGKTSTSLQEMTPFAHHVT